MYSTQRNRRFTGGVAKMGKKKTYKAPDIDEDEMARFKEHSKLMNEKSKAISEKYKKWWDKDLKTWKKGFRGHGNS